MSTKGKSIGYWTTTVLVAFFIGGGGAGQLMQYHANPHGIVPQLEYPMYFFAILGFWKILGAIAILRFSRDRAAGDRRTYGGVVGAAAAQPHVRRPIPGEKRVELKPKAKFECGS